MSVYLDASAILPILVEEAGSAAIDAFVASGGNVLIVSEFAAAEVASALLRLVRMGLLEPDDATARLSDFDVWRNIATGTLDIQPADVRLASIFVRRFDLMLRAPDALHLPMCQRSDYPIVTMDRRLARAAGALGLPVHLLG